jgi:MFS family permease
LRGRAYGLRQSLDTVGAFSGPMLAIALMALFADDMRSVFGVAIIPAALAVGIVLFGVKDAPDATSGGEQKAPIRSADLARLPGAFWFVVALGAVFSLARFSEAFLVLKANAEGLPLALAPLVLVAMNIVYAAGAYPLGILSDRISPAFMLAMGLFFLIVADLVLALVPGLAATFAGVLLWGLHMAATQGLFAKLVADRVPERLRGSAFGVFNLASGLALLGASILAGVLWDQLGASVTFLAGAGLSVLTLLGLLAQFAFAARR